MTYKPYCGVGSRETPPEIQEMMTNFAELAASLGWTLRSGGADGADTAFEKGVPVTQPYKKEIYLPWGAFNNNPSILFPPSDLARDVAREFLGRDHWENLSEGAKKLHSRNIHQVIGRTLNDPAKFLICWTKDGKRVGGTATALKIAERYRIPIFNLGSTIDEAALEKILYA